MPKAAKANTSTQSQSRVGGESSLTSDVAANAFGLPDPVDKVSDSAII